MPPTLVWSSDRSVRIGCDDPAGVYRALLGRALPGVLDITPGFGSVLVEVDPLVASPDAIDSAILSAMASPVSGEASAVREHTIPVCYEPPHAPDLARVAERSAMSVERVIALHAGGAYRVEVIGFSPGFGYLSGLDQSLRTPRLDTPRTRVAPGSVGIAGEHTGVYPQATPGGWNLIGRTPLAMFDAGRDPAALLIVGDRVRFEPISAARFDELASRAATKGGTP